MALLAFAHSSHLSALLSPLSSASGPEKLQLCPLPPRFACVGLGGSEEGGRGEGSRWCLISLAGKQAVTEAPFGGGMKVVSMPSGSRVPPWLKAGAGEGNCAWLWGRGVNEASSTSPGSLPVNSDEPPTNVTKLFWATRAYCDNCSIYSTLSHETGQTGLQIPHYKLQCRTCWRPVSLSSL